MLAETDELHGTLSGPTTLALLERAWEVFGDARCVCLAGLSNGHLYNLWRSHTYVQRLGAQQHTRLARVPIAERRRPQPESRPGYLRIDSVHPGDLDQVKGVYHINAVDEVALFDASRGETRPGRRDSRPKELDRLLRTHSDLKR